MSKFSEKVKKIFSRVLDEAEAEEKKEEGKDAESKPSQGAPAVMDQSFMDEVMKMCKDMYDKMESMGKPKDEAAPKKEEEKPAADADPEKKEEPAKDADVDPSLEARLKKIEEALAKLMAAEAAEAGDDEGEEEEGEAGEGASEDNSEEMGDEKEEKMTGDSAARAEILSPGIRPSKDFKKKALKAAYETKEGKAVIDALSGGKTPTFDSAETVSTLFIAASEVLKAKRGTGLEGTKNARSFDSTSSPTAGFKSAEELNQMHEAYWKNRT